MGLLGGWWGVAAVAFVALFLLREWAKYARGQVVLSARQKVVRVLGGVFFLVVLLMVVFSPVVLVRPSGMAHNAFNILQLGYWSMALLLAVLMLLMAVMDLGEVSRQYTRARKDIRSRTVTPDDIDRLIASERRRHPDHPDEIGRSGPDDLPPEDHERR